MRQWRQNTLPGFYPPLLRCHPDNHMILTHSYTLSSQPQFLHYDRYRVACGLLPSIVYTCAICTFIQCTCTMYVCTICIRSIRNRFSSPAFNYYAQCARRGGGRGLGTRLVQWRLKSERWRMDLPAEDTTASLWIVRLKISKQNAPCAMESFESRSSYITCCGKVYCETCIKRALEDMPLLQSSAS